MFSDKDIKEQVAKHLDATLVPVGHKAAVFVHTDSDTVRTGFAVKTENGWNIDLQTSFNVKQEDHNFALGVNVVKTFG